MNPNGPSDHVFGPQRPPEDLDDDDLAQYFQGSNVEESSTEHQSEVQDREYSSSKQNAGFSCDSTGRDSLRMSKWNATEDDELDDEGDRPRKRKKKEKIREKDRKRRIGASERTSAEPQVPNDQDVAIHKHDELDRHQTPIIAEDNVERPEGGSSTGIPMVDSSTLASSGRPKLRSQTSQVVHRSLPFPTLAPCRSVDSYEKLNRIAEGSYGVVYRARDKLTGEIVALKKLKLENEKNGFPVTSLREIQCLLMAKHPNIVNVKEIVVGESLNNIFMAMEFVPHDLKTLMETMRSRNTAFLISEVKTLMIQLLSGVKLLHDLWIIHRDLKTSNLLMTNTGHVKIADFGLARSYGDPPVNLTQLVVTLWYRAPELLLGESNYTPAIDMWSIGCIFGELVNNEALMPGRGEIDQLNQIFRLLGSPTEDSWPNWTSLPNARTIQFANVPQSSLRQKFPYLTQLGLDLLSAMLAYDPGRRITAEEAMRHPWFEEDPLPKDPSQFPTWPSVASGERRKPHSPTAPHAHQNGVDDTDDAGTNTNALKGTAAEKGPSIFEFESKEGFASGFRLNFGKK